ncbi:MAG TPA: dTDP-4-dehydrorhamnose 3,5-epimerase [Ignavibacteria bacterium]|nr:dTDP-4-dehydrorhamnose 3,5-epimerase [Ignavibacteria bacterium]
MKIIETNLKDVLIIEPDVFNDNRGFFFESYSEKKYSEAGMNEKFIQDNISKSTKGTIRGLHYQIGENAQGKLCQVLLGRVLDVAVDIRFGSPTFGQHYAIELNEENHKQIWIPKGFAHGFSVLSDEAIFMYKCTAYYSKKDERSIIFNDEDLNIDWKVEALNLSKKDSESKKFKEIEKDFYFN